MDDDERRTLFLRHWEYAGSDQEIAHEIYADAAVGAGWPSGPSA